MPDNETPQVVETMGVAATPAPLETPVAPPEPTPDQVSPHPLEPGGERFKQVRSRDKTAEDKLQEEREQRIRLEERLGALEATRDEAVRANAAKTYSWEQLEGWINEGRITRPQANEYREGVVRQQAAREAETRAAQQLEVTQRHQMVVTSIGQYRQALPSLAVLSSPERTKAEAEYAFLVQLHGKPRDAAQQLTYELGALRAAFGDVEALSKLRASHETARTNQEAFVETQQSGKPPATTDNTAIPAEVAKNPRLLEHYNRMMRSGRYPGGWKDVKAELDFKVVRK